MQRVDNMARRLPQLYRDGELLRGSRSTGGVLEVPAVQLESVDDEAREVQRTHWFDVTYELEHAARLAAILGITAESWHVLDTFRPWVHALRNATLKGGVTPGAIESFVTQFGTGFESATGITAFPQLDTWDDAESVADAIPNSAPALIENPRVRRFARVPAVSMLDPLSKFAITNAGMDPAPLSLLLTGSANGREAAPLIANLTTGEALVYCDDIPEGTRLWIGTDGKARLENDDVSNKLRFVSGLQPGVPLTPEQLESVAKPLTLARGENRLWFFPLGMFDVRGLDRFLFSMPDLLMEEGVFDTSRFDRALFHQEPLMMLHLSWIEDVPATFEVRLPAGALLAKQPATEAKAQRAQLGAAFAEGIERLRLAGVKSSVTLAPFADTFRQQETLRLIEPLRLRESGTVGADRLTEHGGAYEVTSFDDSTFR